MSILQERDPMTTFLQPFYINDSVHKKKMGMNMYVWHLWT